MANSGVDSATFDFAGTFQFRLTHQPCRAEITAHPPEGPPFKNDERQPGCEPDGGRPRIREQLSVKRDDYDRNRKPGARQAYDIRSARVSPPRNTQRMQHKPIQRNRELQKQDEGGKPCRESHPRILVESHRRRHFLFLNSAQNLSSRTWI